MKPKESANITLSPFPSENEGGMLAAMRTDRRGPMFSNTIDVTGLTLPDAVELVWRKVQRAVAAEADLVRVVHGQNAVKLRRLLEERAHGPRTSYGIEPDPHSPNVTWILLTPMATIPAGETPWLRPPGRTP